MENSLVTAVRSVRLADPSTADEPKVVDIHLRHESITDIRPASRVPRRRGELDGTGLWAFPGLIDAHVHLCFDPSRNPEDWLNEATAEQLGQTVELNARATLARGVTSVRDLGSTRDHVRTLAAASRRQIPRILRSGPALTLERGHCYFVGEALDPATVKARVNAHADAGDDWLKIIVTGGMLTRGSDPGSLQFETGLISTAVRLAHERGLRVAAHVLNEDGVDAALAARVDTIEHGVGVNSRHIEALVATHTALVPTLATARLAIDNEPEALTEDVRQALELREDHLRSVRIAAEAGIDVIAGSDAGCPFVPHGALIEELRELRTAGLDDLMVCRSATTIAAKSLGLRAAGRLAAGLAADVLLVEGDPRRDIEHLAAPVAVIARGNIVDRSPARGL